MNKERDRQRDRYRRLLIIALVGVCVLLGYASMKEIEEINSDTNQSVLAEESGAVRLTEEEAEAGARTDADAETRVEVLEQTQSEQGGGTEAERNEEVHMVIPCGTPIGIYVKTKGVMVIDTSEIVGNDGSSRAPCADLLRQGDYITSINDMPVEDKNDLISLVEQSGGAELTVGIVRDEQELYVNITPAKNEKGNYMLGLWVKDDISGIGTLTYIDEQGFGALGHSINDNDTGVAFTISDGAIYDANLVNVVKPDGKNPGRLEGMIDYSARHIIGRIEENSAYGIQGYITSHGTDRLMREEWIPTAKKSEAHLGSAYILSEVSGTPEYYQIEITGIDISSTAEGKGIELKVTDSKLLGLTSGIVQGMSGTPIIQDGKLLGAVTHVFLKDSTRGYGTFVEDMMRK